MRYVSHLPVRAELYFVSNKSKSAFLKEIDTLFCKTFKAVFYSVVIFYTCLVYKVLCDDAKRRLTVGDKIGDADLQVAAPSGNLIKRNKLHGYISSGKILI